MNLTYIPRPPAAAPAIQTAYSTRLQAPLSSADSGGILDYCRLLWANRWLFVLIVLCCTIAGLFYSLRQKLTFQGSTSIELLSVNENFLNLDRLNPTEQGTGAAAFESYIATQVEILRDRELIASVVRQLGLDRRPEFSTESQSLFARITGQSLRSPMDVAVERAAGAVQVRPILQTRMIRVYFESTDPQLAATFANALVEQYIQKALENRWMTTQKTLKWLENQLVGVRSRLKSSESELQAYARGAGLQFIDEKNSIGEQQLRQLQDELSRVQAERIAKQSAYNMATNAEAETLPQTLGNAIARQYQMKLTELRREYADLTALRTPQHYKVQQVQAQINELERALRQELTNTVVALHNEYKSVVTREELVRMEYELSARRLADMAPRAAHYNTLKREVESTRSLHEAMVEQVQEANIASALSASNISVVSRATPPSGPYKPSHPLNVSLGFFAGVVASFGIIVVKEKADTTVKVSAQVAQLLPVPELGAIPSAQRGGMGFGIPLLRIRSRSDDPRAELDQWQKPGPMAESFRAIAASLLAGSPHGVGGQVILVTSPGPREGKTMVTSHLGIALASCGHRVLIVDADFRRPALSRIFDAGGGEGFKNILTTETPLTPATISGCIQPTRFPGVDILSAGTTGNEDPRFVHKRRMDEVMRMLRREYEFILVDVPPMLAVADARFVSRFTDGAILVIRANHTTCDAARSAVSRFYSDGVQVLGVVLNDLDTRGQARYAYQY